MSPNKGIGVGRGRGYIQLWNSIHDWWFSSENDSIKKMNTIFEFNPITEGEKNKIK